MNRGRVTAGGLLPHPPWRSGAAPRHLDRDLWFDEAITWRMNQFPWRELLDRVARDNFPPLFPFLLKAWTALFGTALATLRSLSTGCAAVAILGVYLFTWVCTGPRGTPGDARKAGLLAAALAAVSPLQAYWGAQLRMYALGMALAMLSSWAMLRALRASPDRRRAAWALHGVLALLFAYTHYFALFTLAAQAMFIAGLQLASWRGRPLPQPWSPPGRGPLLALAIVLGDGSRGCPPSSSSAPRSPRHGGGRRSRWSRRSASGTGCCGLLSSNWPRMFRRAFPLRGRCWPEGCCWWRCSGCSSGACARWPGTPSWR